MRRHYHGCLSITNVSNTLFGHQHDAPNRRIVKVDANAPGVENWVDVIPETGSILSPSKAGKVFSRRMVDAISKVIQYDLDSNKIREISPGVGTASGLVPNQRHQGPFHVCQLYYANQHLQVRYCLRRIELIQRA